MFYHKDNTKSKQIQQDNKKVGAIKKRKIASVIAVGKNLFTKGTVLRMNQCGYFWEMAADMTLQKERTLNTYNCKSPWCPRCRWLKARKDASRIDVLMRYIQQGQDKRFIFLTLTAPNVTAEKLSEEITRYNKSFKKMMERKNIEKVVLGYIRKLEVTYNAQEFITRDMWYGNKEKHIKPHQNYFEKLGLKIGDRNPNFNTYHPHFHILIAVNKSYISGSRDYIAQSEWLKLWQDVMQDKTITQVDVRKVKDLLEQGNEGEEANKAVSEVAKYAAKDVDYTISELVFRTFYTALAGRQTTTYSGLFAEANKLYKEGELDDLKGKDNTNYIYRLFYDWERQAGEYILTDMRELTTVEKAKLKGQPVDEMEVEMDNDTD